MSVMVERARLQDCFELVDELMTAQEERGEAFDGAASTALAAKAIFAIVPELFEWKGRRVVFEADRCFASLDDESSIGGSYGDVQFRGVLQRASILERTQQSEEFPGIEIVTFEVAAVVVPEIDRSSEPLLALSDRIVVPLREAQSLMVSE